MLAFTVFWAYIAYAQGFIIWIANKPDEVPWYIARGAAQWGGVFAVLLVGHFAIPFFVLLNKALKRRPLRRLSRLGKLRFAQMSRSVIE